MSPCFDDAFRKRLHELLAWRRDVRRFRRDGLAPGTLDRLIAAACLAPSVGLSQPWRFVVVADTARRAAIAENFRRCNDTAQADYTADKAALYARLKLEGLAEAPVQLAVFADHHTPVGAWLGRKTMPETIEYSVVSAIHTLWLTARAEGIGLGWVSILDPVQVGTDLDVPHAWKFVAYLCLGYPASESDVPELIREGWEERRPLSDVVLQR